MMNRYYPVDTGPNWRAVNEEGYAVSPEFCTLAEVEAWIAADTDREDRFWDQVTLPAAEDPETDG
jgi:hypothetical protein